MDGIISEVLTGSFNSFRLFECLV